MVQAKTQCTSAPAQAGQWQVWLEDEFLERAQTAIQDIAVALALFYGYLAQLKQAVTAAERALNCLNTAIQGVAKERLSPAFIGGYPQIGWVLTQLSGKLFEPAEAESCQVIDEALLTYLQKAPRLADYDLISGLTGLGVYALARLPEPQALAVLRLVLQRLAARAERSADGLAWATPPELLPDWQRQLCPNGYYNLGLAHGLPGVIALLARACAVTEVKAQAQPLLEDAVRWLVAHLPELEGEPYFPSWLALEVPPEPSRLAWCYGDLGGATALLYAARCAKQAEWEEVALRILRNAAQRRGAEAGVKDASLCHGAAGNAHLFNRIYQATGEVLFQDAARYWYEQVFAFRQPETGLAGFPAFQRKADGQLGSEVCADLLNGTAGVGLVLLAATQATLPNWDECLLIALPPR
jgi:lantibiotic biosynthesis protein